MTDSTVYNVILIAWSVLAVGIFASLFFVAAPYGRHSRLGWGPSLTNRAGWVLMEAPSALVFALCFVLGTYRGSAAAWVFLLTWEAHYVHRAFIYPLGMPVTGQRMPIMVIAMGACFNVMNAWLNSAYLFSLSGGYPASWLTSFRFIAGAALFVSGFVINRWADHRLRGLGKAGETAYQIPFGGLYKYISCPNYLGEIVEWCGWALATWSLAGLTFAIWTIANLAPRARLNHRWYKEHFSAYPPERRALVPGVW